MSVALHAIRYPYRTRSTLSCAMINRSFCSRSSSRMMGSRRTARSWYDYHEEQGSARDKRRCKMVLPQPWDSDDDMGLPHVWLPRLDIPS